MINAMFGIEIFDFMVVHSELVFFVWRIASRGLCSLKLDAHFDFVLVLEMALWGDIGFRRIRKAVQAAGRNLHP